ncbi:hypothetical protein WG66_007523 [Moniliophthora roreri]|nr:hypothetical protein WG66_007523 [Moniliophthora roreri]
MTVYQSTLSCSDNEMWIDLKNGRIKAGLAESMDLCLVLSSDEVQIPPAIEMLNEDVFVRYLLQQGGSDYGVVEAVLCSSDWEYGFPEEFIEEELRFDTIYSGSGRPFARFPSDFIASQVTEVYPSTENYGYDSNPLTTEEEPTASFELHANHTVLNGFTLKPSSSRAQHDGQDIEIIWNVSLYEGKRTDAWLAQAPRLQRALRLHSTESNVQEQYILCPKFSLRGSLKEPQSRFLSQEDESRSIYLFVSCLSLEHIEVLSDISPWLNDYWSFDSAGESEVPEYLRNLLGLPELELEVDVRFGSLCVHDAIRRWQVARGCNPDTADFAEKLGYPELELVDDAASFEEL